jgi:hypothetical protein
MLKDVIEEYKKSYGPKDVLKKDFISIKKNSIDSLDSNVETKLNLNNTDLESKLTH